MISIFRQMTQKMWDDASPELQQEAMKIALERWFIAVRKQVHDSLRRATW